MLGAWPVNSIMWSCVSMISRRAPDAIIVAAQDAFGVAIEFYEATGAKP
jgi:hypothetical protein